MKTKTAELTGPALDWAVAIAEGHKPPLLRILRGNVALPQEDDPMWCDYLEYSTDWSQGGPIIERENIGFWISGDKGFPGQWAAANKEWMLVDVDSPEFDNLPDPMHGSTPLIAAMRCYVASKLGDTIDIPEKLL